MVRFKLLMEYILIIIVAYFLLKVMGKVLRHFMSPSNVGFWLLILVLLFIPHCAWISLAIIIGRYVIAPVIKHFPKNRRSRNNNTNWSTIIMLAIPIFWPFLILKLFIKDKTLPNDNRAFDYEQYEKSNGR